MISRVTSISATSLVVRVGYERGDLLQQHPAARRVAEGCLVPSEAEEDVRAHGRRCVRGQQLLGPAVGGERTRPGCTPPSGRSAPAGTTPRAGRRRRLAARARSTPPRTRRSAPTRRAPRPARGGPQGRPDRSAPPRSRTPWPRARRRARARGGRRAASVARPGRPDPPAAGAGPPRRPGRHPRPVRRRPRRRARRRDRSPRDRAGRPERPRRAARAGTRVRPRRGGARPVSSTWHCASSGASAAISAGASARPAAASASARARAGSGSAPSAARTRARRLDGVAPAPSVTARALATRAGSCSVTTRCTASFVASSICAASSRANTRSPTSRFPAGGEVADQPERCALYPRPPAATRSRCSEPGRVPPAVGPCRPRRRRHRRTRTARRRSGGLPGTEPCSPSTGWGGVDAPLASS